MNRPVFGQRAEFLESSKAQAVENEAAEDVERLYRFHERAAIHEFDGGLDRAKAERKAHLSVYGNTNGILAETLGVKNDSE